MPCFALSSILLFVLVFSYMKRSLSSPASLLAPRDLATQENVYELPDHLSGDSVDGGPFSTRILARRATAPDLPIEFGTFALGHGWQVTVDTISAVIPLTRDGLRNVQMIQLYAGVFRKIQAICAARMLANAPFDRRMTIIIGSLRLRFEVGAFQIHQSDRTMLIGAFCLTKMRAGLGAGPVRQELTPSNSTDASTVSSPGDPVGLRLFLCYIPAAVVGT